MEPASMFLMLAGSSALRLASAIPEIKRLSKEIREVKAKLKTGVVLSAAQEQVYQQMNMRASELAAQIQSGLERIQAVDETGQLGEPAEIAAQTAATSAMDVARERQSAIAGEEAALGAEQAALEQARGEVLGGVGQGLAQDTSSLVGTLAGADAEKKMLDRMLKVGGFGANAQESLVATSLRNAVDADSLMTALQAGGMSFAQANEVLANSRFSVDIETQALEAEDEG